MLFFDSIAYIWMCPIRRRKAKAEKAEKVGRQAKARGRRQSLYVYSSICTSVGVDLSVKSTNILVDPIVRWKC